MKPFTDHGTQPPFHLSTQQPQPCSVFSVFSASCSVSSATLIASTALWRAESTSAIIESATRCWSSASCSSARPASWALQHYSSLSLCCKQKSRLCSIENLRLSVGIETLLCISGNNFPHWATSKDYFAFWRNFDIQNTNLLRSRDRIRKGRFEE